MSIDIRISPTAFNYADAWLKGIQASTQARQVDLAEEKFFYGVQNTEESKQSAKEAIAKQEALINGDDGGGQGVQVTGSVAAKEQYAVNYLVTKHGLTPQHAAGAVGNFTLESGGMKTTAENNVNERSVGLAQWNGARQDAMKAFAAKTGRNWKDLNYQLDYYVHESKTNSTYSTGFERAQAARTPGEAANIIMNVYELPTERIKNGRDRAAHAARIAGAYNPQNPVTSLDAVGPAGEKTLYGVEPAKKEATTAPAPVLAPPKPEPVAPVLQDGPSDIIAPYPNTQKKASLDEPFQFDRQYAELIRPPELTPTDENVIG
jgi:hypothetical protein